MAYVCRRSSGGQENNRKSSQPALGTGEAVSLEGTKSGRKFKTRTVSGEMTYGTSVEMGV